MLKIKLLNKLNAYDVHSAKYELLNAQERHKTPANILKTKVCTHYIYSVHASQRTLWLSIIKKNLLIMFRNMTTLCMRRNTHMQSAHKNSELLKLKFVGTYKFR
jgi:hypothetical protein